jgi:hypothetical protein
MLKWFTVCMVLVVGILNSPPVVPAFQGELDAVWNDRKATPRSNCKDFVVKAGPPQILRGRTSGQDCLKHAIKEYREGDHEEAFGWILAGACSNKDAQATLLRNAPRVLDYLLKQYGPQVP